ncbi:cell division protein ZapA [Neomegalonema sp.]|uniref:cell division protein ZapA n=1 Tax=Neomegalonema sp. TaxID=2039713 RepID=UPI002609157A|nr:cell division protein ZapA [Neomegalonema sp.]MDD2869436.1 cell division protein ZapA [Neomegalonema sp.]
MADVNLEINGRAYRVACQDGQEPHLAELAGRLDHHAREIARGVGIAPNEARLMLLSGLMVADELSEAENRIRELEAQVSELRIKASASRARAAVTAPPPPPPPAPAPVAEDLLVTPERMAEIEVMVADLLDQAAEQMERMADRLDATP